MFSAWIKRKKESDNINDLIDYVLNTNKYKKIELCQALNISRSTLDKWISNKEYDSVMSIKNMIDLFEYFGYDTEVIFDDSFKQTVNQINLYYDGIIKGKEQNYSMLLNENELLRDEINELNKYISKVSIKNNDTSSELQEKLNIEEDKNNKLKTYINELLDSQVVMHNQIVKYQDIIKVINELNDNIVKWNGKNKDKDKDKNKDKNPGYLFFTDIDNDNDDDK